MSVPSPAIQREMRARMERTVAILANGPMDSGEIYRRLGVSKSVWHRCKKDLVRLGVVAPTENRTLKTHRGRMNALKLTGNPLPPFVVETESAIPGIVAAAAELMADGPRTSAEVVAACPNYSEAYVHDALTDGKRWGLLVSTWLQRDGRWVRAWRLADRPQDHATPPPSLKAEHNRRAIAKRAASKPQTWHRRDSGYLPTPQQIREEAERIKAENFAAMQAGDLGRRHPNHIKPQARVLMRPGQLRAS